MKGSAITGPVAKECVRTRLYVLSGAHTDVPHYRRIYGRVLRRTQAQ
jgi:hypothetical protein